MKRIELFCEYFPGGQPGSMDKWESLCEQWEFRVTDRTHGARKDLTYGGLLNRIYAPAKPTAEVLLEEYGPGVEPYIAELLSLATVAESRATVVERPDPNPMGWPRGASAGVASKYVAY